MRDSPRSDDDAKRPKPDTPAGRRTLRRIAAYGGGLVLAGLLAASLALAALQTGPVRRWLLHAAADAIARQTGWRLDARGASGLWPVRMSFDAVRLADRAGEWLEAPRVRIAVSFWPDSGGLLDLDVGIERLRLRRIPEANAPDEASKPGGPLAFLDNLGVLPVPFAARLTVDRLDLDTPVAGRALAARLSAAMQNSLASLKITAGCERLDGPASRLTLTAGFTPRDRATKLLLDFEEAPGGLAAESTGLAGGGALSLVLDGSGPLSDWRARLEASRAGMEILRGTLFARLGRSPDDDAGFGLELTARPEALVFSPQVRAALGERPAMVFKGTLTSAGLPPAQWKLLVEDMTVTTAAGTASLWGETGAGLCSPHFSWRAALSAPAALGLSLGPLEVHGDMQGELDPAGPFSFRAQALAPSLAGTLAPLGVPLDGSGRFAVTLAGDTLKRNFSLGFDGGLYDLALGEPGEPGEPDASGPAGSPASRETWAKAALALGREVTVKGQAEYSADNLLTLTQARVASGSFTADASGSFDPASKDIDLGLDARVPELSALSGLAGKTLAGSLEAHSRITGPQASPRLAVRLEARRLAYDAVRFDAAGLEGEATVAAGGARGRLSSSISRPGGRLALDTGFTLSKDRLVLSALKAAGPGVDVSGELDANLTVPAASGQLHAGLDLNRLGAFFQTALSGTARLDGVFTASGPSQNVRLTAAATGVKSFGVTVRQASFSGAFTDAIRAPKGRFEASAEQVRLAGTIFETVSVQASGDGKDVAFSAKAKGTLPEPFQAGTSGAFSPAPGGGRLRLDNLRAAAYGATLKLASPAVLAFAPGGFSLTGLDLSLDSGRITARGVWKQTGIDFTAQAKELPLHVLGKTVGIDVSGLASATLRLGGRPQSPTLSAAASLNRVRIAANKDASLPEAGIEASLEYSGERLAARSRITAGQGVDMLAQAVFPARFGLRPAILELPGMGALEASLTGTADLAVFAALAGREGLSLRGVLKADLAAGGTLEAPRISGRMDIENGVIEYAASGTVLHEVALHVDAASAQKAVLRFSATDGAKGTLRVNGSVGLAPERRFPVALDIDLDKAALARTDMASAVVSGRLGVSGDAAGLEVKGDLSAGQVEVNIPDRLPPDVVVIEIEPVGGPAAAQPPASLPGIPVRLDCGLDFPERIFVRGQGLDSVWTGRLRVGGTALSPAVTGDINAVRGRIDFFGTDFNLVKGQVTFTGGSPPEPTLDLDAQTQRSGITADVLVTGNAAQPEVAFASDPPLPKEEIISRVLFGQSVSQLSAPQALQLAQAAGAFLGQGNALDLLGKTRKLAGLDYLGVGSKGSGAGQSSLVAGKYVTDKIYLETGQGLGGNSGTVSVNVDLIPHLTLDSSTGLDSKTSVGLDWKMDY